MTDLETMFFNKKEELKEQITDLVRQQIEAGDDAEVPSELKAIGKELTYDLTINASCEFEPDCSYTITGDASCSSVSAYNELKSQQGCAYFPDTQKRAYGYVDWDGNPDDGTFEIQDYSISIEDLSLNTPSEEAQTLLDEEEQVRVKERRKQDLIRKAKEVERLQEQIKNLNENFVNT